MCTPPRCACFLSSVKMQPWRLGPHLIRVGSPQRIRVLPSILASVQSSSRAHAWWMERNAHFCLSKIRPLEFPWPFPTGYLGSKLAMVRREWGLASSCSRCARSWRKWGRRARSYAQQFFMSSYKGAGQSTGGGSRYPSSMLFITCSGKQGGQPQGRKEADLQAQDQTMFMQDHCNTASKQS